jgi:hypothetical protein
MARAFDDASSEYLALGSVLLSSNPHTMAAWVNLNDGTNADTIMSLADTSSETQYDALVVDSSERVMAQSRGNVQRQAVTAVTITLNTWQHVAGVWAGAADRTAYVNGGNAVQSTASVTQNAFDDCGIGIRFTSVPAEPTSGAIAEAAAWNVALTAAEIAILAAGFSPLFVRPASLVAYWPLIRDEDQDRVGGYDMTAFNTPTIAAHPPVIYPALPIVGLATAAAPVAGQPMMLRATTVPGMRPWHPRIN